MGFNRKLVMSRGNGGAMAGQRVLSGETEGESPFRSVGRMSIWKEDYWPNRPKGRLPFGLPCRLEQENAPVSSAVYSKS